MCYSRMLKYNSRTDRHYGKALNGLGGRDQWSSLNMQVILLVMLNAKWDYIVCWPTGALCKLFNICHKSLGKESPTLRLGKED